MAFEQVGQVARVLAGELGGAADRLEDQPLRSRAAGGAHHDALAEDGAGVVARDAVELDEPLAPVGHEEERLGDGGALAADQR
ncbi:MAG: hypothetical protein U0841_19535 [Chloroflexia bacterium]